jgi:hypothetical protein
MSKPMTFHSAQLFQNWQKLGGTLDGWKELVAPRLQAAGEGPLYKMTPEMYDGLFVVVR